MKLLNFIFRQSPTVEARALPDDDDYWYSPANFTDIAAISAEAAMSLAAVYSCIRILAESVGSLPLILYRKREDGGKDREENHPLSMLLRRKPNKWQTKIEFWEMMVGHVALRGNAFAQKITDGRGNVLELWPLNPTKMKVGKATNGMPTYLYTTENGQEPFDYTEILHIKGLSSDGLVGLSPLEMQRRAFDQAKQQEDYNTAFFRNMAQPGGIIKHPGRIGEVAAKNLKDSITKEYGGSKRAFKTMILEEGMAWEQVGISQRDAQFLELKKFSRSEIAGIFRVPPHLIGDLERATFSNIEQQSLDFVQNTLTPWLVRIEEAIWHRVILEKDQRDLFAEFLVQGILRGDITTRYQAYSVGLMNGFLSPDEVRSYENLNPIPDGSGKIFRVPLNTTPSNAETDPQKEPEETPPPAEPDDSARTNAHLHQVEEALRACFNEIYGRILRKEGKISEKLRAGKTTEAEALPIIKELDDEASTALSPTLKGLVAIRAAAENVPQTLGMHLNLAIFRATTTKTLEQFRAGALNESQVLDATWEWFDQAIMRYSEKKKDGNVS